MSVKNVLKNLGISFLIQLLLLYLFLFIFGNLNAIFSFYFLVIVLALLFSIFTFIPFIIRWIYLKEFYLSLLIIPSLISLLIFILILHIGFGIFYSYEQEILNGKNSLFKYKEQKYVQEFKNDFIYKNSSNIFGEIDFKPKLGENLSGEDLYPNVLYYNNYVLNKDKKIVQELHFFLDNKEKNIDNNYILNSFYNLNNRYSAYFNHVENQKYFYENLIEHLDYNLNFIELNNHFNGILLIARNNSKEVYEELRISKEKYETNTLKFEETSKYCDGIYKLNSGNIIFLEEIPNCMRTNIDFQTGNEYEVNISPIDTTIGNRFMIVPKDYGFIYNPLYLVLIITKRSDLYSIDTERIIAYSSWQSQYRKEFINFVYN